VAVVLRVVSVLSDSQTNFFQIMTCNNRSKPTLCTITGLVLLLFIAALIFSLTYLSLITTARATASASLAQFSTSVFHRLYLQFNQTLYNVNVISNALTMFCNINNNTFVHFLDGLGRLDNGDDFVATDTSNNNEKRLMVSFPYSIVWTKLVPLFEIDQHVEQLRSEVKK
jgi:hypothetical protein